MNPKSRGTPTGPTLERTGHGICDRAVDATFFEVGRLGVAICDHGDELKVTYAMPSDATPIEVRDAYEASQLECENRMTRRRGKR